MIKGIGTDIIEIERIKRASQNDRFLERIYSEKEREYCLQRKNPYACLAGRFAAKEAVLKALGTGIAGCAFKDVEVLSRIAGGGAPEVNLSGGAKLIATKLGIGKVLISISHDETKAVSFAIATSKEVL